MADFSFGFTEVSDRILNNKQKELNEFIKNGKGADIIKLSSQYFSQAITLSDFYSACENKNRRERGHSYS